MARYELKDDDSSKFWEINVVGDTYEVRYGRIGTDGQSSTKAFASEEDARRAADKITATKVKKGYQLAGDSSPAPVDANVELETLIKLDPQNTEAWQVYADYLQTQNDPHGDLIALGIAIDQSPNSKKGKEAQAQFDKIFKANYEAWMGSAAKFIDKDEVLKLEWKYGYILKAHVSYDYEGDCPDTDVLLADILKNPVGNFIQDLAIGATHGSEDGEVYFSACIGEIVSGERRLNLKRLFIGDCYPPEADLSWCDVGDCRELYLKLPNLETLKIRGGDIEFGKIKHLKLKSLVVESGGLNEGAIKSLVNADLPNLESLEVWFGADEYGAQGTISMLKTLFTGKGFPALKNLGLMNSEFQDEIALEIVNAPILKRLQKLDMSMGTMMDRGASALLENAESLAHLKYIDLADNYISDELAAQLKKLYKDKVNIKDQDDADDYGPYVSAGE